MASMNAAKAAKTPKSPAKKKSPASASARGKKGEKADSVDEVAAGDAHANTEKTRESPRKLAAEKPLVSKKQSPKKKIAAAAGE